MRLSKEQLQQGRQEFLLIQRQAKEEARGKPVIEPCSTDVKEMMAENERKKTMTSPLGDKEIKTIKCFCCGKKMDVYWDEGEKGRESVPSQLSGLWFIATGNYGSTIYDPLSDLDQHLRIAICDECVVNKKNEVTHITIHKKITSTADPFDPDEDH